LTYRQQQHAQNPITRTWQWNKRATTNTN